MNRTVAPSIGAPASRQLRVSVRAGGGFGAKPKQGSGKPAKKDGGSSSSEVGNAMALMKKGARVHDEIIKAEAKGQPLAAAGAAPPRPKGSSGLMGTGKPGEGFIDVGIESIGQWFTEAGKDKKAYTLAAGRTIMLYKHKNVVYASDVYSTAYKFPLVDANIMDQPETGFPMIEVPLDGTQYDLLTGKVLKWCPTDSGNQLVRGLLGTLKGKSNPVPLEVFPTIVTPEDRLLIRLL